MPSFLKEQDKTPTIREPYCIENVISKVPISKTPKNIIWNRQAKNPYNPRKID